MTVVVRCPKCGYEGVATEGGWYWCPVCDSMYETSDIIMREVMSNVINR